MPCCCLLWGGEGIDWYRSQHDPVWESMLDDLEGLLDEREAKGHLPAICRVSRFSSGTGKGA